MPAHHEALLDLDLITITFSGTVVVRDVLHLIDAVENDPECKDDMLCLVGLKDVEDVQISVGEMRKLADINLGLLIRRGVPRRIAVWAPCRKTFDFANAYYARLDHTNKIKAHVSDDLRDALAFLDKDDALLTPKTVARLAALLGA